MSLKDRLKKTIIEGWDILPIKEQFTTDPNLTGGITDSSQDPCTPSYINDFENYEGNNPFGTVLYNNTVPNGVTWAPGYENGSGTAAYILEYDGPNTLFPDSDAASCANMVLTDIVVTGLGAPSMEFIMQYVLQQIWAGNEDYSYDTQFDQVYWQTTTMAGMIGSESLTQGGYSNNDVPVGGCINPNNGNGYRRFRQVQIQIAGLGTLPGNPGSWAELFTAIEQIQPDVAYDNNGNYAGDIWWNRIGGGNVSNPGSGNGIEDLNEILSWHDLNGISLVCGAQGSCIGTCMCNCNEEECLEDGVCSATVGCDDPNAINYNPDATINNPCSQWVNSGSEFKESPGFGGLTLIANGWWYGINMEQIAIFQNPDNISPFADQITPSCACQYNVGCTQLLSPNFDESIFNIIGGTTVPSWFNPDSNIYGVDVNFSSLCGPTDEYAYLDDPGIVGNVSGMTQYFIDCMETNGLITSNEECELTEIIEGCTNETAENYNPDANQDDGSCVIYGCALDNISYSVYAAPSGVAGYASNYNPDATIDDGSCIFNEICCDPNAYNYVFSPNTWPEFSDYDNFTSGNFGDGSQLCDTIMTYNSSLIQPNTLNYVGYPSNPDLCQYDEGCTDLNALNYDPDAGLDDGSCQYVEGQICPDSNIILPSECFNQEDFPTLFSLVNSQYFDIQFCAQTCIEGTYNPGTWFDYLYNGIAYPWDDIPETNLTSSCQCCCPSSLIQVEGCMDSEATNYNPDANFDDDSCEYPSCYFFNELEEINQINTCDAYFNVIGGGTYPDPNLAEIVEDGACCENVNHSYQDTPIPSNMPSKDELKDFNTLKKSNFKGPTTADSSALIDPYDVNPKIEPYDDSDGRRKFSTTLSERFKKLAGIKKNPK